jgi:thiamine biosynthesis lipoprotein
MEPKMGSPFAIILYSDDSVKAGNLAQQCFSLVDSFNLIFSDYIDSSELKKLSASAGLGTLPINVSPALFDILMLSKNAYNKSGKAFDITIGPVVKLWREARKTKQFPAPYLVQSARKLTGFENIHIDSVNKLVRLTKRGMQLDLGGIAKGYIAQKIIDFLLAQQVNCALVNAGGDIVMSSAPPGSAGWRIGTNVPETSDELLPQLLLMQNEAVATSGDVYQFIENGGKRYSHIIDPRSGYGVTFQRNVTVIANDGATADWLATACSVLSTDAAKRLAMQLDAEVLISEIKNGKVILNSTQGFDCYWEQQRR